MFRKSLRKQYFDVILNMVTWQTEFLKNQVSTIVNVFAYIPNKIEQNKLRIVYATKLRIGIHSNILRITPSKLDCKNSTGKVPSA